MDHEGLWPTSDGFIPGEIFWMKIVHQCLQDVGPKPIFVKKCSTDGIRVTSILWVLIPRVRNTRVDIKIKILSKLYAQNP